MTAGLKWRATLALMVAVPGTVLAQVDRGPVTVGTAVARRGETAYGAIIVAPGVDSGTAIPVAVVYGTRPGPVLAVIAGSHGTEYTSTVALTRLIARLDPKTIAGTVIIAPLLNLASFRQMTVHANPVDGKGMNGQYPGDASGTQTQRALAAVADQIIKPADVILDLHGGDLDEDLRPYAYWFRGGVAAQDSAGKALALAFGLDHIIILDMDLTSPVSRRNVGGHALALGKTVVIAEAGRSGIVLSDDVAALIDGTLNVMGALRMLDRPVRLVEHPVWLDAGARVAGDGDGMFYATVGRGTFVTEGMPIGYTTDFLGRRTGEVRAPASGVVTFIRGVPSMWKGATLVNIGRVLPEPPPYAKPTR